MIRQLISHKYANISQNLFEGFRLFAVFLAVIALLLVLSLAQISGAQENTNANNVVKEISEQLKEIQDSIVLSEKQSEKLKKEMQQLTKDRTEQAAALIASAQRVKLAEIEVSALEESLSEILVQKKQIEARLAGTNKNISNLLLSLQRLGRSPAPALLVDPSDAVNSARSAILLSAILPQLRSRAAIISNDLQQLNIVNQKAFDEEDMLRANLKTLAKEQLRVGVLIEAREKEILKVDAQLQQNIKQSEQLSQQAKSLEELIANLNNQIPTTELEQEITNPTSDEEIKLAYANISRTSPAIPFDRAKGYLTLPAAGVIVTKFLDDDGYGGKSKGISIVTRAEAQVVAPNDGWIIYKGPYLNYGQIVIINTGNDYTIVLAGLEETNVKLGQFILRGEPIGKMGLRTVGQAVKTSAGTSRPTLYVELRKQDIPLDSTGWWEKKNIINQSG